MYAPTKRRCPATWLADHNWNNSKAQINGTAGVHITAIFGFTLASLVVNDLYQKGLAEAKDAE